MFIKQLWHIKLDWDEPLLEDHNVNLDSLNNFKISRYIFKGELSANSATCVFRRFIKGAVAYIQATLKDERVIVQLLCAKTWVAPELCAAYRIMC